MVITRRDIAILGTFAALLIVGVVLFVRQQSTLPEPSDTRRTTTDTRRGRSRSTARSAATTSPDASDQVPYDGDSALLSPAAAGGTVPPAYQVILTRALFTPLFTVAKPTQVATKGQLPPVPAASKSGKQQKTTQTKGRNTPRPSTAGGTPGTGAPTAPPAPPVAVTGLLRWGNGYRVVLEHTEYKLTRILRVGDEAWGYRVAEVSEDARQVTLEVPGGSGRQAIMLKLGEGKKVETTQSTPAATEAPKPAEPSRQPSMEQPGMGFRRFGFDPSQLTPEQRQRMEEWRARRAQRRGEGGGGGAGK